MENGAEGIQNLCINGGGRVVGKVFGKQFDDGHGDNLPVGFGLKGGQDFFVAQDGDRDGVDDVEAR